MPFFKNVTPIDEFDIARITPFSPQIKEFDDPKSRQTIRYVQSQFRYKHSTPTGDSVSAMFVQLGPMNIDSGIRMPSVKSGEETSKKRSLVVPLSDVEGEKFRTLIQNLRDSTIDGLIKYSGDKAFSAYLKRFSSREVADALLSKPYHNYETGDVKFLPLIEYDEVIKTTFLRPCESSRDGVRRMSPAEVDGLQGTPFRGEVTVFAKRAFIGNNPSIQLFADTVLVLSVEAADTVPRAVRESAARAIGRGECDQSVPEAGTDAIAAAIELLRKAGVTIPDLPATDETQDVKPETPKPETPPDSPDVKPETPKPETPKPDTPKPDTQADSSDGEAEPVKPKRRIIRRSGE